MVLTADDILNGIEEYKEVKIESLNDTMFLRPLSKGEWEKINSIRQEALGNYETNEKARAVSRTQRIADIESKLSFSIKESGDADFNAQVETIYKSLDNPGYEKATPRDKIRNFPPDVFDELYEKVREISGISDQAAVTLEDDVEEFPED